jgi:DNA-binding YbaB/EbfC family protein
MTDIKVEELMAKAKEMQQKMEEAQKQLADTEVTGESGGGMVKVIMNARYNVQKVVIDPEALKESKDILEALIAAAMNDATTKIEKIAQMKIIGISREIGLPTDEK